MTLLGRISKKLCVGSTGPSGPTGETVHAFQSGPTGESRPVRAGKTEKMFKKMKTVRTIYILKHDLKWSTFKMLQKTMVKDSGPKPIQGEKAIWELLRDRKILCWFAEDMPNDMGIGYKIPQRYKKWKVSIIGNVKYEKTK